MHHFPSRIGVGVYYRHAMAKKDDPPETAATPSRVFKDESADRIYRSVMRSGGEPFGAPFENGTASLTSRIVQLFKQAGFFGFETLERLRKRNRRNKFTRHAAAPFLGQHRNKR
jgi:hypothetical protein